MTRYHFVWSAFILLCLEMEDELDVSNSTIRRAIRKLIKLEMIRRVAFIEPQTLGPGANIYVILPVGGRTDAVAD
ncbi:hypothetical protein [Sporosarcina sp. FSL K6-3508]|uniref:hypothetical protein n=1 Tax=Sporosarcina sp. FSL K6-3508 TaxID=2921557 RepID=UPI00315A8430